MFVYFHFCKFNNNSVHKTVNIESIKRSIYLSIYLKIRATGDESSIAKTFKIHVGKLSGPEAFPRFNVSPKLKL